MKHSEFKVEAEDEGTRLDVFISRKLKELSRSHIQKLIEDESVKVEGKTGKASLKLKLNQIVEIEIPEPKGLDVAAQDIPIEILYEDGDIAVVNKPKGMVVHPACGNRSGTLVNALLFKCEKLSGINGVIRPGIVHRIDKDTSGILVIAKNDNAHIRLSSQFKEHSMKRRYTALVYGNIKGERGMIDAPIGRHKTDRKKFAVVDSGGKRAVTHFNVVKRYNGFTLIKAELETGRTHQIRVHMAYLGHPLVGDKVYGPKKEKLNVNGQMLHAELLGFVHPSTGKYMEFKTPLPEEFKDILKKIH